MAMETRLPQEIEDRLALFYEDSLVKAAETVFEMWHNYFMGDQTPEAAGRRREAMSSYIDALAQPVRQRLDEERDGKTLLGVIRDTAARLAQEERLRLRQPKIKLPPGAARGVRRAKASERRGIKPGLIH